MTKVLVCGGRHYHDVPMLNSVLDGLHLEHTIDHLIHGACHLGGADHHAERWAKRREVMYTGVPAKWKDEGMQAGHDRVVRMINLWEPDLVLAFPGGQGTQLTEAYAAERGIRVVRVTKEGELV